jgi:GAG-pre-integrase domain
VVQVQHYPENTQIEVVLDYIEGDRSSTVQLDVGVPSMVVKSTDTGSTEDEKQQALLLRWHSRLGHISMHRVQRMAAMGLLPISIAKCKVPLCQACVYGMMTRRAWRTKAIPSTVRPKISSPGQHISVDQLEYPTPGIIVQLKGYLLVLGTE